jgi:hypothetical protein
MGWVRLFLSKPMAISPVNLYSLAEEHYVKLVQLLQTDKSHSMFHAVGTSLIKNCLHHPRLDESSPKFLHLPM